MLQRRRECFNGHRFTTYEISDRLAKTLARLAEPSAAATKKSEALWRRDQAIVRAVRGGKPQKDVAAERGLATSTVAWIIKRLAPDLRRDARSKKTSKKI